MEGGPPADSGLRRWVEAVMPGSGLHWEILIRALSAAFDGAEGKLKLAFFKSLMCKVLYILTASI